MIAVDWNPIISAVMTLLGAIITGLAAIYVPRAIAAFEKRTGVQVTELERQAVYAAMQTAAGILKTKLDQGLIRVQDITPTNLAVVEQARAALARVPDSAAAQGTTVPAAATIIAARVDTSPSKVVVFPGAKT